jgi:transcriptional regulator with XRE-family HTH domain
MPNLVRSYLAEKNMTQREFAKKVGVDEAVISRILNTQSKRIDLGTVEILRAEIGFGLDEIVIETADSSS